MSETMIEEARGNLLLADVDALVNTVNTVGVMGKGIALQFKRAYPEMFNAYVKACKAGEVETGKMHLWRTGSLTGPRFIVNFPTKRHWRAPSRIEYINDGLKDLVRTIRDEGIESIAIPPLGAGNGGLDWMRVRPRIIAELGELQEVRVLLFEPTGAPAAEDMVSAREMEPLTKGRAALINILSEYTKTAVETSLIELQKLMYFLQEAGEPLRLNYQPNRYGPYADNLRHVLLALEGSYLTGFGDGSSRVLDAEPIRPLPGAADAANAVLIDDVTTRERINRVLALSDGFDSMYGMELLATVHWAARRESATDLDSLVSKVQSWSPRKREFFSDRHIAIARERLTGEGWIAV